MDQSEKNKKLAQAETILVPRSRGGDVRFVIAYPNNYHLGMSSLAFHTIYRLASEQPRFSVERAFVDTESGAKLRTFESGSALAGADIVAVSCSFELDYPNIAALARQTASSSGFPRTPADPGPLLLGGGAALTLNPEPVAGFFDLIFLGESEESLPRFFSEYLEAKERRESRHELLRRASSIPGFYVPSFYKPVYRGGMLHRYEKTGPAALPPRRAVVEKLEEFSTTSVIITPETEFSSMLLVETGRGCEMGCRFCAAGYMYRPVRKYAKERLIAEMTAAPEAARAIGLVGASVSRRSDIEELLGAARAQGKRAGISSLMAQELTPDFAKTLADVGIESCALAPEAGSEELRFRMGKRISDARIIEAARLLVRNRIPVLKLYFMLGLPFETREDVAEIAVLTRRIRDAALEEVREQGLKRSPQILLSVNAFIPKPLTPFQRHGFMSVEELRERVALLKKKLQAVPGAKMKHESIRSSWFQAILSRGDRRLGEVLLFMYNEQKDWKWLFSRRSKEVAGAPAADMFAAFAPGPGDFLPWEIVESGVRKSVLEREYQRAICKEERG